MAGVKRKGEEVSSRKKTKSSKRNTTGQPLQRVGSVDSDLNPVTERCDAEDGFDTLDGVGASSGSRDDVDAETETGGVALPERDGAPSVGESIDGEASKIGGLTSKEAHAKQKALAQERKAAKPHAPEIQRSKQLWESLRRKKNVPGASREGLVEESLSIMSGHIKDFVFKHDAVRVVQTTLKYANTSQRLMIAKELKGHYCSLAEGRYSKFLIRKLLIKQNFSCRQDQETRNLVIPEFYGHVRRLMRHPEAASVLDAIYSQDATSQQKAKMLREWYGSEYSLLEQVDDGAVTCNLSKILEISPEKRTPTMRSLFELINLLVQKKMTGFQMLHDAMLEYISNVQPRSEEATDFIEMLRGDEDGDIWMNLASTKPGSKLVSLDRRHILKAYKDHIHDISCHDDAKLILLAAYEVVDDTVMVAKTVFPELLGTSEEEQEEAILRATSNLSDEGPALLYLPAGPVKSLLSVDHLALLKKIVQIRQQTSKKDAALRRRELLDVLSPPLIRTVQKNAKDLCEGSLGCRLIVEVLLGCTGDKSQALEAVAAAAAGDPSGHGHPLGSIAGAKMLKRLVSDGRYNTERREMEGMIDPLRGLPRLWARLKARLAIDPPLRFHEMLYDAIRPRLVEWASGPGSFVVVGLLEAPGFSRAAEVVRTLKDHLTELRVAAESKPPTEEKRVEGTGRSKRKAVRHAARIAVDPQRSDDEQTVPYLGLALLLQKLG
ncbi:MAG: pumilio domain member 6 [Phylliscum demangeonii]|nr:MAG: pumilio domain member 6 [Phylliscum demangeonii]